MLPLKKYFKLLYEYLPFKKEVYSVLKTFYIPPKKIYQHLHFKGIIKVKINESKSFKTQHIGNIEENEIFWNGLYNGWEKKSITLWARLCKGGSVIFDIGANTGLYGLVAQTVSPDSNVHCFEPIQAVYNILEKNISLNNYPIHSHSFALSDYNGKADIYMPIDKDFAYSVTINQNTLDKNVISKKIEIEVKTLATFIEENKIANIDLMKIDVETHEAEVLKGMGMYLSKYKPTMIIEVLNDAIAEDLNSILNGMGYLYFNIDDEKNSIRQVEKISKSDYWNFLVCNETVAKKLNLV